MTRNGRNSDFSVELRLIVFIACLFAAGLSYLFFIWPPFWALMDDGTLVASAQNHFSGKDFYHFVFDSTITDMRGWGLFRPVYYSYIYLFYGYFRSSSIFAYVFIFILTTTTFWMWALLFEKCMAQVWKNASENHLMFFRWLFFLLCFLFTPHYNLLFFSSLQERFVLLFDALAFWGLLSMAGHKRAHPIFTSALIAGSFLAFFSKLTFVFQMPLLTLWLFILWRDMRKQCFLILCVIMLVLTFSFILFSLSIRTGYTSGYQLASIGQVFWSIGPRFHFLFWFSVVSFLIFLWHWFRISSDRKFSDLMRYIFWPLSVISYLMVLLPWGTVAGHYMALTGIFIIGNTLCLVGVLTQLVPSTPFKRIVILIVLLMPLTWFAMKKLVKEFRQHHGTGLVVNFLKDESNQSEIPVIVRMPPPCLEASDHMNLYIGKPGFVRMLSERSDDPFWHHDVAARKLLVINKECTEIPSRFSIKAQLFQFAPWHVYEGVTN